MIQIETMGFALEHMVRLLRVKLGISKAAAAAGPAASSAQLAASSTMQGHFVTTGGNNAPQHHVQSSVPLSQNVPKPQRLTTNEDRRIALLLDPNSVSKDARTHGSANNAVDNAFGRKAAGTIFTLAHYIIHRTKMFVYGGFLRDFIVFGEMHGDIDLDVGMPKDGSIDCEGGSQILVRWARSQGIVVSENRRSGFTNPNRVKAMYFVPPLDSTDDVQVEFVDSNHFAKMDARIDFDVNNLCVKDDVKGQSVIMRKIPDVKNGGPADVQTIFKHIRRHEMTVPVKPVNTLGLRIQKMQSRGWKIVNK